MKNSVFPLLKLGAEISVHLYSSKGRCFCRKKKEEEKIEKEAGKREGERGE